MRRQVVLLVGLIGAGCGPARPTPPGPDDTSLPVFGDWPTATPRPIPVELALWRLCRPLPPEQGRLVRERHGPHLGEMIVVRVSPDAADAFRAGGPLPVGAVVVKEKRWDHAAAGKPAEYAAMVKREAGYDPDHGDWEYLYVAPDRDPRVTRGRVASCIECHRAAPAGDYLYRSYLPPKP